MKKLIPFVVYVALMFTFQTCSQDEERTAPGNVQFAFQSESFIDGNGRSALTPDLPEGSKVLISVKKHSGEIVFTHKSVNLLMLGGEYITEPLALPKGGYYVTDFLIVSSTNEVLFATPMSGSALAALIDHPVPFYFAVKQNKVINVDVEVVSTDFQSPAAFGFATFEIELVSPELLLSVFIPDDQHALTLTSGHAYIIQQGDTLAAFELEPRMNIIDFDGDPTQTYELVVIKDAYSRFRREFVLQDLQDELQGTPLTVILEPALTMIAVTSAGNGYDFEFGIFTTDIHVVKTLTIDWGDGSILNFETYNHQYDYRMQHTYGSYGQYFVSVTGDIDIIMSTGGYFHLGNKLNLDHLSELTSLSIDPGPLHLDLSHNAKMAWVEVQSQTLQSLDVSNNHGLIYLSFQPGYPLPVPTGFTSASLNQLIAEIHGSVVLHPRQEGRLYLARDWASGSEFIVPPFPETIQKLRELRDVYGWVIVPNP